LSDPEYLQPDSSVRSPRQLIDWAAEQLSLHDLYFGHGTDNPLSEAEFLVLRSLDLPLDCSDAVLDTSLVISQLQRAVAVVNERITTRKPAAYLLGEAWFAGLRFYVNEHVLVPRSPIAELILEQFSPWCKADRVRRILDIGTGSGCIAIASAFAFAAATVDAIDVDPEALAVARKNVESHGLRDRVALIRSDLFQELTGRQYDLIIANPPYVDAEDLAVMPAEYRHEPSTGLYGGRDGLVIVRRILESAGTHLTENGVLVIETGNSQKALREQYPRVPFLWLEFQYGGDGVFILTRQ
jgi:protein-(glutamine-N5) methyltransferase, ribosomal protein L3-specific